MSVLLKNCEGNCLNLFCVFHFSINDSVSELGVGVGGSEVKLIRKEKGWGMD
jgi:hypothetical protein